MAGGSFLVLVLALAILSAGCGSDEADHKDAERFLMPVEDVFVITGRGTVVTGRVEQGAVQVDDEVELVGMGLETRRSTVLALERFQQVVESAEAGETVGVLLGAVPKEAVETGQVLAEPGSAAAHSRFTAHIELLSKAEGGLHTPVFDGYEPTIALRTAKVSGVVSLPDDVDFILPGGKEEVEISIDPPVAMEAGSRFTLIDGTRTIGAGTVGEIRD